MVVFANILFAAQGSRKNYMALVAKITLYRSYHIRHRHFNVAKRYLFLAPTPLRGILRNDSYGIFV